MDDHFWPAVYPGLAIGLIYGLYVGGWANAFLGAFGGIVVAALSFSIFTTFLSQDGLLPLGLLLVASLIGAICVVRLGNWVLRRRAASNF